MSAGGPGPVGNVGGSAAPQFIAPAPPSRVQMTLQQHYDAILALFRTRPPRPDEIAATQQFFQQWQAIVEQEMAAQQGADGTQGPMPGGAAANLNGQEQPYGSAPGAQDLPGYEG